MLYIDVELVSAVEGASGNTTWAALPLSRSFEELVLSDADGDGLADEIPVVGYTASYEYSFDNQDLYFDVVSSAPYTDFDTTPGALFDFIVPQRVLGGSSDIDLRLVVIPDELYFANGRAGARVDLRDYAAVKRRTTCPTEPGPPASVGPRRDPRRAGLDLVPGRPQRGALDELVGRLEAQLLLDVDAVRLDRLGREHHGVGHLGRREPLAEVAEHLELAVGQLAPRPTRRPAVVR